MSAKAQRSVDLQAKLLELECPGSVQNLLSYPVNKQTNKHNLL